MAQKFEALVLSDPRFEVPAKRHLGMVVFRLVGDNELTERLLKRINSNGKYVQVQKIVMDDVPQAFPVCPLRHASKLDQRSVEFFLFLLQVLCIACPPRLRAST